jgi:molybdenum cofactor cytidylyltransferase
MPLAATLRKWLSKKHYKSFTKSQHEKLIAINKDHKIAGILLAAGSSSRLGKPKQLLPYMGQPLIASMVREIMASELEWLIVVLGAEADVIQKEINGRNLHIVINDGWKEGMASSIRIGIEAAMKVDSSIEGVIFFVSDQPFINASLIHNLVSKHFEGGAAIVASAYANTIGIPAFFHHSLFHELLRLQGDSGAKRIMQQHPDLVADVLFPRGNIDIDTLEDYNNLLSEF